MAGISAHQRQELGLGATIKHVAGEEDGKSLGESSLRERFGGIFGGILDTL